MYAYRAEDHSLLMPIFGRKVVAPLVSLLPPSLHPNVLTLLGFACCLASSALTLLANNSAPVRLSVVIGFWLYVLCDNLDGAHARRTQQTSLLGEMLDHGLDSFNSLLIVMAVLGVFGVDAVTASPWLLLSLAHALVVLLEQRYTGVFRLPLFNQLEAISFASVLVVFAPFARQILGIHLVSFGSIVWAVSLLAQAVSAWRRLEAHPGARWGVSGLCAGALTLALAAGACTHHQQNGLAWWLLLLGLGLELSLLAGLLRHMWLSRLAD